MKKIFSIFLTLCIIVNMLPVTAMAEEVDTTIGGSEEIISFAPLIEIEKLVSLGTSIEDLGLPKTVIGTVRTNSDVGMQADTDQQTVTEKVYDFEYEEISVDIEVTWTSQPEYDMDTEGVYVFAPMIAGYTVSAPLPEITVTVEAELRMPLTIAPKAVNNRFYAPITIGSKVDVSWEFIILTEPDGDTNGTVLIFRPNSGLQQQHTGDLIIPETVINNGNTYAVTEIGTHTFNSCKMSSIFIPKTIGGSIGADLFGSCPNLVAINVDPENASFLSEDGVLYNKDKTTLIRYPEGKTGTTFAIPTSVDTLSMCAFYKCESITSMTIPDAVTTMGSHIFSGCSALADVTIGSGISEIQSSTFRDCAALELITFKGTTAPTLSQYALPSPIPTNLKIKIPAGSTGYTGEDASDVWKALDSKIESAPATNYAVWVGGIQVSSANKDNIAGNGMSGTITYAPETKTLTMNGVTIPSTANYVMSSVGTYGIYASEDLKIQLVGTNSVTAAHTTSDDMGSVAISVGTFSSLTIDGSGSLTAQGGNVLNTSYQSSGIATYNLTINSGTVTARGNLSSGRSVGIYSSNLLNLKGGTITAVGGYLAMNKAPNFDSYENVQVTASKDVSGTLVTTYNTVNIADYKYLKFESAAITNDAQNTYTGTIYPTLQEAFDAVGDGQTIQLLKDINLTTTVTIANNDHKSFTLDLNGKTLNSGSNIAIKHSGTGTLTIKDTGTDGKITSKADINSNGTIDLRGGILAVESGTIENTLNNIDANAILKDHGENGAIIVTGGTIISTEGTAIYYSNHTSSSDPTIPSGILIPSGTPIIKGGLTAMNMAPDLSSYTNVKVIASTNYDGSEPVTYNADNYYNYNYKYLKFEPGSIPTFLTGSATISNTSPRIGDVLKGSIVDGNNTGTLTYIWKAARTQVGTGENYTVTLADLGKAITVEINSSVEIGTVISTPTMAVLKKVDPSSPAAPILSSKTYNTVTLTANIGYQFSKDGTTWQTSNVFSGLTESTTYIFYQRIAETNDTEASAASTGLSVTTNSNYAGGGSDSSSDESSNSSSVIVIPPTPDKPNSPTQGEIKVPGTADSKGNITATITNRTVTEAFDEALANAKKNGNEQNGITVVLRVDTGSKTGSNVTVNLPKTVQDTIIAKKIVNTIVVVDNPDIRIDMDLATVQEINKQAKSDVNITATRGDSDKLTGDAKKAIGSRPVFDLKVNYGSDKQVQSFGAGSVSVTIPYTLGANEKAENVQAVYVDGNGKVHWLTNSVYDSVAQVLHFATSHFSTYGIGYKQPGITFTDIASHWAKEDIEFVVNRGLLSGTSASTFSPNTAVTRGMFVTALGRLANADVSGYTKSSFTDVKSDAYYMGYIEWASINSIIKGTGNGRFAPDQSITREQMAVIMENYAKVISFTMPKVHGENTFDDSTKISIYAKDAVNQMQMAGVISGKNGNLFDPQGTATRAEVSAVLRRFVEMVISSDNRMSKMQ